MANPAARNASRRLLREVETWHADQSEHQDAVAKARTADGPEAAVDVEDNNPNRGIERLGPVGDDDLFHWEAVLNGQGVGHGYDNGRWLLQIDLPPTYPLLPPTVRFKTPVLHANVHPTTGAVCLDLLNANTPGGWTPALSVAACIRAIRLLLSSPGLDSPLNVDMAALQRAGDDVAAKALVRLWCGDSRYAGQ